VLPDWDLSDVQVQALTTSRLIPARVRRFTDILSLSLANR
jgi:hypothetical protein